MSQMIFESRNSREQLFKASAKQILGLRKKMDYSDNTDQDSPMACLKKLEAGKMELEALDEMMRFLVRTEGNTTVYRLLECMFTTVFHQMKTV